MRHLRTANNILRSSAVSGTPLRTTSSLLQNQRPLLDQPTLSSHSVAGAIAVTRNAPWNGPLARPFSHTATCQKKKGGKKNHNSDSPADNNSAAEPTPSSGGAGAEADGVNPFDFTDLQNAFDRAESHFSEELKKLRSGGRFNAEVIGAIPVQPDKKQPAQTFPLRELATVAPLGGRRWSILAFEEGSVKPIVSAVQRSPEFNQQPQRSADNPLELTMTVEPERADALARRAKEVCQAWRVRVRDDAHRRAVQHKKWRGEGVVLSDDAHKLKDKLQKLQDERMKGILAKEKEVIAAVMARAS
ncbi:ribosome recycling factor-domain-containing protein [Chaetomium fimeti]|uniref:Ribosome recycling factor-domain-containing protein n=1 Tax=Chaetomium fimeti TaxID=1854472 RepID=A0AAE0LXB2_9PEZI|nr:ribosome recycling factor-domain-containing protein [Chaetomium fimeti]